MGIIIAAGALFTAVYDVLYRYNSSNTINLNAATVKNFAGQTSFGVVGSGLNGNTQYNLSMDDGVYMMYIVGQQGEVRVSGDPAGKGAECIAFFRGNSNFVIVGQGNGATGGAKGGGKTIAYANFGMPAMVASGSLMDVTVSGGGGGRWDSNGSYDKQAMNAKFQGTGGIPSGERGETWQWSSYTPKVVAGPNYAGTGGAGYEDGKGGTCRSSSVNTSPSWAEKMEANKNATLIHDTMSTTIVDGKAVINLYNMHYELKDEALKWYNAKTPNGGYYRTGRCSYRGMEVGVDPEINYPQVMYMGDPQVKNIKAGDAVNITVKNKCDSGNGGICSANCYPVMVGDLSGNSDWSTSCNKYGEVKFYKLNPTNELRGQVVDPAVDGKKEAVLQGTTKSFAYDPLKAVQESNTALASYDCGIRTGWVYSVSEDGKSWQGVGPDKNWLRQFL